VHAKKLAEVKAWLSGFGKPLPPASARGSAVSSFAAAKMGDPRYGHGQGLLILTGPSGSARSAMLRVLARDMGYQIVSWDDESGSTGAGSETSFGFRPFSSSSSSFSSGHGHGFERKMDLFRSFFAVSTRYSLALSQVAASPALGAPPPPSLPARALVLLEELPYLGKDELRAEFLSVLMSSLHSPSSSLHPIVLCVTTEHEAGGGGAEHAIERTFGKELLQHPRVALIKCNPINNTELIKALQRVIKGEQLDVPDEVMRDILDSCFGDVRHAISTLQYLCVAQTAAATNDIDARAFDGKSKGGSASASSKRKRVKKKGDADSAAADAALLSTASSSHRDDTFSVFHSAGKILYAKSTEVREVERIVEAADVTPLVFLEWIHTNYVDHLVPPTLPVPSPSTAIKPAAHAKPSSASAAAAGSSPTATSGSTPGGSKYFDDDDDLFGPELDDIGAFDRALSSAAAAAAARAPPAQTQQQLDAEALQALVECTEYFSQADVLASGAKSRFGDSGAADEAVEELAAAEIACSGYITTKRALSWTSNAQINPKRVSSLVKLAPARRHDDSSVGSLLGRFFCDSCRFVRAQAASTVPCLLSCGDCRSRSTVCSSSCSSCSPTKPCWTWRRSWR